MSLDDHINDVHMRRAGSEFSRRVTVFFFSVETHVCVFF